MNKIDIDSLFDDDGNRISRNENQIFGKPGNRVRIKRSFCIDDFDKTISIPQPSIPGQPLILKPWQLNCYNKLLNKKYYLIDAPTGAGKAVEIAILNYKKLQKNPKLFNIISTPQRQITRSFNPMKIIAPDKSQINWDVEIIGIDKSDLSNAKRLLTAITSYRNKDPLDRIIVCCNATLVLAYDLNPEAFTYILYTIDEVQHLLCEEYENEDLITFNKMGKIVHDVHSFPERNNELGLVSATPFRGDKWSLLSKENMEKVTTFKYPYDEHLRDCNFDYFDYNFVLYERSYEDATNVILNRDSMWEPSLIYVPDVNSRESTGKYNDVNMIFKMISNSDNPEIEHDGILTRIKRNGKWLKGIELVVESDRKEKYDYTEKVHNSDNNEMLDFVVALRTFREGANWKYLTRILIPGVKNITDVIQRMGRALRKANNKNHATVYHILPYTMEDLDKELSLKRKENYYNSIVLSMQFEHIYAQCKAVKNDKIKRKKNKESNNIDYYKTLPANIIHNINDDIIQEMKIWTAENPQLITNRRLVKNQSIQITTEIIQEEIENNHLTNIDVTVFTKQIITKLWKRAKEDFITFDINKLNRGIVRENPAFIYLSAMNAFETFETLQKFKECVERLYGDIWPIDKAQKIVSKLGFKNNHEYAKWWRHPKNKEISSHLHSRPHRYKDFEKKGGYKWFFGKSYTDLWSLDKAQKVISKLGFKNNPEYVKWWKNPKNKDISQLLHSHVYRYKDFEKKGGYKWFFGKSYTDLWSLDKAQKVIRPFKFFNPYEYLKWWKNPKNRKITCHLYSRVHRYKDFEKKGGYKWFFGKQFNIRILKKRTKKTLRNLTSDLWLLDKAQKVVSKLGFKNNPEYVKWWKNPKNRKITCHLLLNVWRYKDFKKKGGYKWFFGKQFSKTKVSFITISSDLWSTDKAQRIISKLNLSSNTEYIKWWKNPKNRKISCHLRGALGKYKDFKKKGGYKWFLGKSYQGR